MTVTCALCGRLYNDEHRWTICPHNSLDVMADTMLCHHCDVYLGYTNAFSRTDDPDVCCICGRTRQQLEAELRDAAT